MVFKEVHALKSFVVGVIYITFFHCVCDFSTSSHIGMEISKEFIKSKTCRSLRPDNCNKLSVIILWEARGIFGHLYLKEYIKRKQLVVEWAKRSVFRAAVFRSGFTVSRSSKTFPGKPSNYLS